MKIILTILFLGFAQASHAAVQYKNQCQNSQYQVNLRMDASTKRCGFDVAGLDIRLGYVGQIQSIESGIECKGMAFAESPYHLGTLVVSGETGTLTFENGAAIYLKCQ